MTASAGLARTDADADRELFLPPSELTDWRLALGLSESLGLWSLGQDLSVQRSDDRQDPGRFADSAQLSFNLSRSGPVFGLFGQLAAVRSRRGAERDRSRQWLVSLQPSWRFEAVGVTLQPYVSWSRTRDDLSPDDLTSESYRFELSWEPSRVAPLALQAGATWSRDRGGLFAGGGGFVGRYTLSVSLRGRRRLPTAPPAAIPFGGAAATAWDAPFTVAPSVGV